ncbi:MAG: hypothetical protein HPY52_16830 [Firmicutes bacterium]|nr:hypothetical protein [Bacillota bacterium]
MGLRNFELPGSQVLKVLELASKYRGPSRADLFALALAIALPGVLLISDKRLREAAENEGVPVHGTLWLLDEEAKTISDRFKVGSTLPEWVKKYEDFILGAVVDVVVAILNRIGFFEHTEIAEPDSKPA